LDARRAAVRDPQLAARTKLVALGVAAEVVVVVEDEDAGAGTGAGTVEVRCGQTADAAADDDEIVRFAGVDRLARRGPEPAVANCGRDMDRSVVAAAQARQRRRVVAGAVLGELGADSVRWDETAKPGGPDQPADADGDTVQEIAPGYRPIHAEVAVM